MMKKMQRTVETELDYQEILELILDLSKKINDLHRLHFSEQRLSKRKNQKQKFLAEILTTPARNSNNR